MMNEAKNGMKIIGKMMEGQYTLRDLKSQLDMMIKYMEPMSGVMSMFGMNASMMTKFTKNIIILDSCTSYELDYKNPMKFLSEQSRIQRLALGSGNTVKTVKDLFLQIEMMKKMFKRMLIGLKYHLETGEAVTKNDVKKIMKWYEVNEKSIRFSEQVAA